MAELAAKRVLVVGAGNSGCDIACDAAQSADAAFISLRRGYHFVPKHLFGVPADVFATRGPHLPMWLAQRVMGWLTRWLNGDVTRLGLQAPDHRLFESHPIMNTQLLHLLAHGDVTAKPDVAAFEGHSVRFADGSTEEIDLVILATGYRWRVPYIADSLLDAAHDGLSFQRGVFSRHSARLYGIGFIETNSSAYRLFDEMADVIGFAIEARIAGGDRAAALDRSLALPEPDLSGGLKMVGSGRHHGYFEAATYKRELARFRKRLGWPTRVDARLSGSPVPGSRRAST